MTSKESRTAGVSTVWWAEPTVATDTVAHVASYTRGVARKKIQIRPPGLKPTTKVGTLGPYRGRLGLAWVVAPLVAGIIIVLAGYFALFR